MPPVVVAAGITAAGALGGAALASRSANKASEASTKANDAALAYAKEQEAQRRADYERAYAEWQAGRQALLSRYGISVPSSSAPRIGAPTGGVPGMNAPAASAPLIPRGQNLAAVGAAPTAQGEPYERWNDWRSYGLPSA